LSLSALVPRLPAVHPLVAVALTSADVRAHVAVSAGTRST
jgi:hypothetical protein